MYNSNYYQPPQSLSSSYTRSIFSGLKGRPVSSIDEARASTVDFDGTVFYFPDPANKRIYTKQINVDGTATLLMYEQKEIPAESQPEFVTKEEFENVIAQLKNLIPTTQTSKPIEQKTEFKF